MIIHCNDVSVQLKDTKLEFLTPKSVLIYTIRMADFIAEIPSLSSFCDAKELARSRRYLSANDCNRFIVTRGLLRLILSKFHNTTPQNIEIEIGDNKKPRLRGNPLGLNFNISHTQDWAVIALSKTLVGVDLEDLECTIDYMPIMDSCFSEEEKKFVNRHTESQNSFYRFWTRKEAILKLIGKGIDDDMKTIEVLDGLNTMPFVANGIDEQEFRLISFDLPGRKIASLAFPMSVPYEGIEIFSLNAHELLNKQYDNFSV